jgi:hypothetical protein
MASISKLAIEINFVLEIQGLADVRYVPEISGLPALTDAPPTPITRPVLLAR